MGIGWVRAVQDRWEGTPRRGKRGGWIQVSYKFGVGFALKGRTKLPKAILRPPRSERRRQKTECKMPGDGTQGAVVPALSPAFAGH